MHILPSSFSSDTNRTNKIKNSEINSLFDGDNVGFERDVVENRSVTVSVTFNYPASTFIDYIDTLASAGTFRPNSKGTSNQHVQIKITYVKHDGATVSLSDTGKVSYPGTMPPKVRSGRLYIHNFVKRIDVYLYSYCYDQESRVSFGKFLAYGSYDSGVRFRRGSMIHWLAHEPDATNCVIVKRNGLNFKIPLVPVNGEKVSPIRLRRNGVTYALKYLLSEQTI